MSSLPPSATLYFQNLNEKLKRDVLRRHLYELCVAYGRVTDMVVSKAPRLRGQAWVVFDSLQAASLALRSVQGLSFFGKALRAAYAKPREQTQRKHPRSDSEDPEGGEGAEETPPAKLARTDAE